MATRASLGVSQERTHALYGPIYAELNLPVPARVDEFLDGPRPIVYVAITSRRRGAGARCGAPSGELGVRVLVAGTVHALQDLASDRVLVEGVLPAICSCRVSISPSLPAGERAVRHGVRYAALLGIPLQPGAGISMSTCSETRRGTTGIDERRGDPELGRVVMQMIATGSRKMPAASKDLSTGGRTRCLRRAILELINLRPASDARSASLKAATARA